MALPTETRTFANIGKDGLSSDVRGLYNSTILEIEIRDKGQRVKARPCIGIGLSALLVLQNAFLVWFIIASYQTGRLEGLAPVISVVCPATLLETAAIVHTMVKWIFSDVEYKTH
jgi:uncharacterized membrane protein YhdT